MLRDTLYGDAHVARAGRSRLRADVVTWRDPRGRECACARAEAVKVTQEVRDSARYLARSMLVNESMRW